MPKFTYDNLVSIVENCICEGVWGEHDNELQELAKQSCNYCDLIDFIRVTINRDNFVELLEAYMEDVEC